MARRRLIEVGTEAAETLGVPQAAVALNIPRATLYRHTAPPKPRPATVRRPQPRALTPDQRREVMDTLKSERFVDLAPKA